MLNRLPIKLLPGQRGTGRRHSSSTSVQVRLLLYKTLLAVICVACFSGLTCHSSSTSGQVHLLLKRSTY